MRLDKFFSQQRILSRKEVGEKLRRGLITVNGQTATKGDLKIDEALDVVALDGVVIPYKKYTYIVLNKPQGYVCSTDDPRDMVVTQLLPPELQKLDLFPCGRLDKDTTGLVILTNDGVSAHRNLSPKHHVEKRYRFQVADPYSDEDTSAIEAGITLADGYTTKPCKIERTGETSGYITLTEGKYHEIKRLFGARGNKITALERVSFASIELGELGVGEWREMNDLEIEVFHFSEK